MMKPILKTVVLLGTMILLLGSPAQSTAQSSDPSVDSTLAAHLHLVLSEEHAAQRLRGLSAARIVPDQGVWQGVSGLWGTAASDVMRPDIRFGIASIKKTFVATLVLQLAEEGVLNLDDSLHQWVPEVPFIDPAITLRHLLSHTSGIYNYTEHPSFWNTLWTNIDQEWTAEEVLSTFVLQPPFAPGSRFAYSNTNYLLLSMVYGYQSSYGFVRLCPISRTFLGALAVRGDLARKVLARAVLRPPVHPGTPDRFPAEGSRADSYGTDWKSSVHHSFL